MPVVDTVVASTAMSEAAFAPTDRNRLMMTAPEGVIRIRSTGLPATLAVFSTRDAGLVVPRKLLPSVFTPVLPPSAHAVVPGAASAGDVPVTSAAIPAPPPTTRVRASRRLVNSDPGRSEVADMAGPLRPPPPVAPSH